MRISDWSSDVCSSDLDARHRRRFVGADADAQEVILRHAEKVIDDLEALGADGIVDPGDFHELLIAQIVAKADHHARDGVAAPGAACLADGEDTLDSGVAPELVDRGTNTLGGGASGARSEPH